MVVLAPEVFAEIPTADLMVMLWLGLRHRVVVLDEEAPVYVAWLGGSTRPPATTGSASWETA